MQNLIEIQNNLQQNDDLIHISKKELRSLYRRIIECEKIIEEYKSREHASVEQKLGTTFND